MYKKILVPLDGSPLAECVLPHVETIAKGCGVVSVTLLRVVEPFNVPSGEGGAIRPEDLERISQQNKETAQDYLNRVIRKNKYPGASIESKVITGLAADTITDYATKNEVDLVVMATHGRSGISRWVMGSVADRVVRSTCVPVLLVRAPGCFPGV